MKIDDRYACGKQFEAGDRVRVSGYTGTIEKISADWEEDRDTPYKGKRFQQAIVEFEPSVDGIEKTSYNHGAYGTFSMGYLGETEGSRSQQAKVAAALQEYLGEDYAVNFDDCESTLTRVIYKPLNKLVAEVPNGAMRKGLDFAYFLASKRDRMQVYNLRSCGHQI